MNPMENNYNEKWILYFEEQVTEKIIPIKISPEKTIMEAINLYKIRRFVPFSKDLKFIFNGKELFPDLKIHKTGLFRNSRILVVSQNKLMGI